MPRRDSLAYVVLFAGIVCVVCSVFVAGSAVLLAPRQQENRTLDRQRKVVEVAGLTEPGVRLSGDEVRRRFSASIEPRLVDLTNGIFLEEEVPESFDPRKAARDPSTSRLAPENDAGIRRLPNRTLAYVAKRADGSRWLILPIEGLGLWSTLYGFLALDQDGKTIRGITFYEHGETPGLGAEVDNPRWQSLWPDRKAFDDTGRVRIEVAKGRAGSAAEDPHRVDGISGATLTCRGVTAMLHFWLGPDGFGPLLERLEERES